MAQGVNRYTQLSNPRFDPRSLQEMMLAPSYMRGRHDAASDSLATAETALAQVDPLDIHGEVAQAEQKRLYDMLQQQSDRLASDGFSNTTKSDMSRLNKDYQNSIGPTGLIGKANAAKVAMGKEKQTYISNATKSGYSPTAAEDRWNEHVSTYSKDFDESGKISDIGSLYAPKYHDVVAEAKGLFKEAGFDQNTLYNDLGTGEIVKDEKGQYVVTTKGYKKYGSNVKQLQSALDYMNNQINNADSEVHQSLIHQGKTSEQALQEIEGLKDVFTKTNSDSAYGKSISNFSPNKPAEVINNGSTFLHGMVKGINASSIDPNSPLVALENTENLQYDSEGNITAHSSKYNTYEDKVNDIKNTEKLVSFNPRTGLYEYEYLNPKTGNYRTVSIKKDGGHYKQTLDNIRTENPYLTNLSDKQIIDRMQTFKDDLSSNYVGTITPVGSNFGWMNDNLFGSQSGAGEKSTGTLSQTGVTIDGSEFTSDQMLKEFGYSNMQEFKEKGSPSIENYVPSMGKWRSTAYDSTGNQKDFFTEAPEQVNELVKKTRAGYEALLAGKSFAQLGEVNTANFKGYMYLTNDFINPQVVFSSEKVNSLKELKGKEGQSMDYKSFSQLEIESLRNSNTFNALSGIDKTNK